MEDRGEEGMGVIHPFPNKGVWKFIIELNLLTTAYRQSAGNVQHPTPSTTRFGMTRRAVSLLATSIFPFDVTRRAECLLAMLIFPFDVTRRAARLLAMLIPYLGVTRRAAALLATLISCFNNKGHDSCVVFTSMR